MAYGAMVDFCVTYWTRYVSRIAGVLNGDHLDIQICWLSNRFRIDVCRSLVGGGSDPIELSTPFGESGETFGYLAATFAQVYGHSR